MLKKGHVPPPSYNFWLARTDSYILDPRSRALPFCACLCLAHSSQRPWGRKWNCQVINLGEHAHCLPWAATDQSKQRWSTSQKQKKTETILIFARAWCRLQRPHYECRLPACALWLPLMRYLIPWWLPVTIHFPGWLLSQKKFIEKKPLDIPKYTLSLPIN